MTSFVIQNALIVDGTGKPGFLGSVAVEDDQIVEVGSITSPGDVIIDAEGLVLAPGIIVATLISTLKSHGIPWSLRRFRMVLPLFSSVTVGLRSHLVSQKTEM